jgi:hypothetical protein
MPDTRAQALQLRDLAVVDEEVHVGAIILARVRAARFAAALRAVAPLVRDARFAAADRCALLRRAAARCVWAAIARLLANCELLSCRSRIPTGVGADQ